MVSTSLVLIYLGGPQLEHTINIHFMTFQTVNLEMGSIFIFLWKSLGIASPSHLCIIFQVRRFLCYILLTNQNYLSACLCNICSVSQSHATVCVMCLISIQQSQKLNSNTGFNNFVLIWLKKLLLVRTWNYFNNPRYFAFGSYS